MELTLSVRSFQVPATPGTCAWPPSLPSVPTSRATRRHLGGEGVELIHHRVDGVLQLAEFRLCTSTVIFLDKIAVRHGGGHFGDVADLAGEVGGHRVHVVGEILPGAGHAGHLAPGRRACLRCPLRAPRGVTSAAKALS